MAEEEHPQGRLSSRLGGSRHDRRLQACRSRQNKVLGPALWGPHSGCWPWSHPAHFPSTLERCWAGSAFKPTLKGQTHPEGPVSVGNLAEGAPPCDA